MEIEYHSVLLELEHVLQVHAVQDTLHVHVVLTLVVL